MMSAGGTISALRSPFRARTEPWKGRALQGKCPEGSVRRGSLGSKTTLQVFRRGSFGSKTTLQVSSSPRYWFPGAYAERGARGDPGPLGPRGPAGPPGPVGPDAASSVDDLDSRVSDLEDSISTLQDETGSSTLESDVQDATDKLDTLCSALLDEGGGFEDVSRSLLSLPRLFGSGATWGSCLGTSEPRQHNQAQLRHWGEDVVAPGRDLREPGR